MGGKGSKYKANKKTLNEHKYVQDNPKPEEDIDDRTDVKPREPEEETKRFIGQLSEASQPPKQYIGQMKTEDKKPKEFIGQLDRKEPTHVKEEMEIDIKDAKALTEITDFDDKDIDIDDESKLFLKEMLLSNVETCDTESLEADAISIGVTDEESGADTHKDRFQPNFADFPSHITLRRENRRYLKWKKKFPNGNPTYEGYPLPDEECKQNRCRKELFMSIDNHALKTPQEYLNKTVAEVVSYLIRVAHNDLEKARVIFRWCCAQNLAQIQGIGLNGTLKSMLINIREDKGSYTRLYENMCSTAGLQCEVIKGIKKGADYKVGEKLSSKPAYSSWVAVKIAGLWRLVDLNFAARHQTGGDGKGYREVDDAPVGLTYILDEFYFLTDPEQFIYNHFPDDAQWQLLVRPITKQEFQDMAYLRGQFFKMGMDVLQAKRCTLHAPSGESFLTFGLPKGEWRQFMYRLWKSSKDGNMDLDKEGNRLTQFVYLEQKNGTVICRVMYPATGKYKFQLYIGKGKQYTIAAEYLLLCTEIKELCPALPINNRKEWGPGQKLSEIGITPLNCKSGTIETDDGEVELVFEYDPAKPVDLSITLSSQKRAKTELKRWTLYSTENGKITINLRLQEKGHYALDIFADHKTKKTSVPLACTYLIVSTRGVFNQLQFPASGNQKAGSVEEKSSVSAVSHPEPYFTSSEGLETIEFHYESNLKFSTKLCFENGTETTDIKNHIFKEQEENKITFTVRFPKAGMYCLSIFAKKSEISGPLSCIYHYIVHVPIKLRKCKPFPKTSSQWGVGCKIQGLTENPLCEDQLCEVSVVVPKAADVAIIKGGEDWTYLKKNGQQWTGSVNTGAAGKPVNLSAKFLTPSYYTLLEYNVLTADEMKDQGKKSDEEYQLEKERMFQEETDRKKRENDFRELEKELSDATGSHNLKLLHKTVGKVEARSFTTKLKPEYDTLRNSIKSLERTHRLDNAIMKLDSSSIADVQRKSKDSEQLAEVMKAIMLLLNGNGALTKDFESIENLGDVLKKAVAGFCVSDVVPEAAADSLNILKSYRLDDVKKEDDAAAILYAWCLGITEEHKIMSTSARRPKKRKQIPFVKK